MQGIWDGVTLSNKMYTVQTCNEYFHKVARQQLLKGLPDQAVTQYSCLIQHIMKFMKLDQIHPVYDGSLQKRTLFLHLILDLSRDGSNLATEEKKTDLLRKAVIIFEIF